MGFVLCTILSAGVIAVSAQTVTREIIYGVRVNVNGQLLELDADNRPFVMGGRTFLPVRAIADAFEEPVDFDASTNTVYLGNRFMGQRSPLRHAAPFFDRNPNRDSIISFADSTMNGVTYHDTLRFTLGTGGTTSAFSLHNLQGQFRTLNGYIGRADGSNMRNVTVNFIGDSNLLQSFDLDATAMPIPINVFVEGVQQLRIEVDGSSTMGGGYSGAVTYAIQAFLE
jgi:hypothetical protein